MLSSEQPAHRPASGERAVRRADEGHEHRARKPTVAEPRAAPKAHSARRRLGAPVADAQGADRAPRVGARDFRMPSIVGRYAKTRASASCASAWSPTRSRVISAATLERAGCNGGRGADRGSAGRGLATTASDMTCTARRCTASARPQWDGSGSSNGPIKVPRLASVAPSNSGPQATAPDTPRSARPAPKRSARLKDEAARSPRDVSGDRCTVLSG